jgi:hypothetical protein
MLLAGCGQHPADAPHLEVVADVKQLMTGVLEPAADTYWDAVGTVIDEKGTHETAPSTDEEWAAVWRAALVVAESGNLLMVEGRARDRKEWMTLSRALVTVGKQAVAAAAARDPNAVFDVGGQLFEACTACHASYVVEIARPADSTQRR